MSDAKASGPEIFDFNVCSQCMQPFDPSSTRDIRHAVPCGHVFCTGCLARAEAEQRREQKGWSACRRAGCERALAPVAEFAASWVAQRAERIKTKYNDAFVDQGDIGDPRAPTCSECGPDADTGKPHLATHQCETCGDGAYFCMDVATSHPRLTASSGHVVVALGSSGSPTVASEPTWNICVQHKVPFRVVESSTHRPLCAECLAGARGKVAVETFEEAITALGALGSSQAALSAELSKQKSRLAEPTFTAEEFRTRTANWGADQTARIRAWEEREVKHVQALANESVQLVEAVCARRIKVAASLITQRMGLRASLEEFDQALADLPSDPASRLSKMQAVYAERKRLCELLAESTIEVPSAQEILKWAELPALSKEFGQKAAASGVLANAVRAGAKAALDNALWLAPAKEVEEKSQPEGKQAPSSASDGWRVFPVIPELDAAKGLRSIRMRNKPTVFVGLDDNVVVVGFQDTASLQVWDLVTGKLVRAFEGKGKECHSMVAISDARIAVGWHNGRQHVLVVFSATTGKQLQTEKGFAYSIQGMAFVEDHLLTLTLDKGLQVWDQDSTGQLTEKAKIRITGHPYGMMTVLSSSTVAISMYQGQIQIWDWTLRKRIRTLADFDHVGVYANAMLPDGRIVAGDLAGCIRVGSYENWNAATTTMNRDAIIAVLVGRDGSFLTTDGNGGIKLWRDGVCEVALKGASTDFQYHGLPLAVVGRRLVAVGGGNILLVSD